MLLIFFHFISYVYLSPLQCLNAALYLAHCSLSLALFHSHSLYQVLLTRFDVRYAKPISSWGIQWASSSSRSGRDSSSGDFFTSETTTTSSLSHHRHHHHHHFNGGGEASLLDSTYLAWRDERAWWESHRKVRNSCLFLFDLSFFAVYCIGHHSAHFSQICFIFINLQLQAELLFLLNLTLHHCIPFFLAACAFKVSDLVFLVPGAHVTALRDAFLHAPGIKTSAHFFYPKFVEGLNNDTAATAAAHAGLRGKHTNGDASEMNRMPLQMPLSHQVKFIEAKRFGTSNVEVRASDDTHDDGSGHDRERHQEEEEEGDGGRQGRRDDRSHENVLTALPYNLFVAINRSCKVSCFSTPLQLFWSCIFPFVTGPFPLFRFEALLLLPAPDNHYCSCDSYNSLSVFLSLFLSLTCIMFLLCRAGMQTLSRPL